MLINKIILENYGLYNGTVEFDLTPRPKGKKERPIILFGGNNGAGKTTLLDAIRLVFYGKSILGNRVSQSEYEDFLEGQIHRAKNAVLSPSFARVGMKFQHVYMGKTDNYYVERSWTTNNDNKVKEYLKIIRNDEPVESVTKDYWRGFVEEIIPERLSQLFFFDGEKIKAIAEDKTSNHALAESIKILLGLDLVDRLKADLSIYRSKEVKTIAKVEDRSALSKLEDKITNIESEITDLRNQFGAIESDITGNENEIKKLEGLLDREGVVYAHQRNSQKDQKVLLASRIDELNKLIGEECEKTFPFSLCPTIASALRDQIKLEQDLLRINLVSGELDIVKKELLSSLEKFSLKQDEKTFDSVANTVQSIFAKHLAKNNSLDHVQEIHGLSNSEQQQLFEWLNDGEERSAQKIEECGVKLNTFVNQLHKIEKNLVQTPDEEILKPIFEKLNAYNQNLGICLQRQKQIDKNLRSKINERDAIDRDKTRLEEKYATAGQTRERLTLVKNVKTALDDYLTRLTEKKIAQLRSKVAECFNHLSRKGNIISHIEIDPKTFHVTLFDHNNAAIPKKSLSAGEKQIFAIAMLWGLAKTAKRPLPVIIDTPLGRLDSEHRSNLINNYFPEAAHQVILFSTDTEVDKNLYQELSPNISHCYHLEYDKKNKLTTPKEGYFWKEAVNA